MSVDDNISLKNYPAWKEFVEKHTLPIVVKNRVRLSKDCVLIIVNFIYAVL